VIRLVVVVVPACNEQDTIAECLTSVARAAAELPSRVAVRTMVVLDRCTDGTQDIVAGIPGVEAVVGAAGTAGAARALGAATVLASCGLPWDEVWIANTDADSTVPLDWLTTMLASAELGVDLLLGTVIPGPGLEESLERAWRVLHRPVEDHPHVHGANFGIRADTYLELGGWERIATGEDVALALRATAAGLRIRRTAAIPVITSSRLVGRATAGFADYLSALASEHASSIPA
jgi:GT2 family glycosyltransferase